MLIITVNDIISDELSLCEAIKLLCIEILHKVMYNYVSSSIYQEVMLEQVPELFVFVDVKFGTITETYSRRSMSVFFVFQCGKGSLFLWKDFTENNALWCSPVDTKNIQRT